MSIRIRLGSDDDGEDGDGWSDDDAGAENQTLTRWFLNPTDLGGVFTRATVGCIAATILSLIAMVGELLIAAEEPFVDQPTLENPISGWMWLLSQTGAAVSVFGYTAWSFWKQRQLKSELTNRSGSSLFGALQKVNADSSELSEYEKQVQKTIFAFVVGVVVGTLPGQILLPL